MAKFVLANEDDGDAVFSKNFTIQRAKVQHHGNGVRTISMVIGVEDSRIGDTFNFVKLLGGVNARKAELLELARQNPEQKIKPDHPLYSSFSYHAGSGKYSCSELIEDIGNVAPKWMLPNLGKVAENKHAIISMNEKPSTKNPLYKTFFQYMKKDPDFKAEVYSKHPNWFKPRTDSAEKKAIILNLLRTNGKIPTDHPYYSTFVSARQPRNRSWDPAFSNEAGKYMKQRSPRTDSAQQKAALLALAQNGLPKPSVDEPSLFYPLMHFTSEKNSRFDPEFRNKLFSMRPDWMKRRPRNSKNHHSGSFSTEQHWQEHSHFL